MSLHSFLYRYLFGGIGILLVIGMLTILALAIRSQLNHADPSHPHAPTATHGRPEGEAQ